MKNKKAIEVLMDDREPMSIELFKDICGNGLKFIRKRLNEGDYVYGDVCVERKTIDDFCSSILDGRIESQVRKMKEKYKYNFVIIVGRIKDRCVDIHEHCVLGKMASLEVKHGVNVLCVDDDFQFIYIIKNLFEKIEEEEK